jgi:methylated-DNA-protein-cysteine methyltransferase related protein
MRAIKEDNNFFSQVYQVVRLIPSGRVTSYGAIAKYLGTAKSARMVGWAMNVSHAQLPPVPAHRVVNRIGLLTGKAQFENPDEMENKLMSEGIEVKNDQIQQFDTVFWDPMIELSL